MILKYIWNIHKFTLVFSKMWWGFMLFGITTMSCWTWYRNRTCGTIKCNVKTRKEQSRLCTILKLRKVTCAGVRLCFLAISPTTGSCSNIMGSVSPLWLQRQLYKIACDVHSHCFDKIKSWFWLKRSLNIWTHYSEGLPGEPNGL